MAWTSPADIQAKVRRLWDNGRLLAAGLKDEPLFPLSFSLAHPGPEDLSNRFEDARRWIQELEAGARAAKGFGYEIVRTEINNRRIGRNILPTSVSFTSEEDALRLIGKVGDAARFRSLAALTLQDFPGLEEWLAAKPMKLLDHAGRWERLLSVLDWLRRHPRPEIYIRQMDLRGVDTKFIESCEGILTELSQAMASGTAAGPEPDGRKTFETRFGFRSRPDRVRFRILDTRMHIQGLSDLTAPVVEVAGLSLPVKRVFITENDINGLAFPLLEESLVFFGLGYGVEILSAIPWLHGVEIFYWGDIDTHGFAILDRLRSAFPDCRSILMDRETLMAHQEFWVEEPSPARAMLTRLTGMENELYEDLVSDRIRKNLRLEQERVGFHWVEKALGK